MKKIFFALTFLLTITAITFAQDNQKKTPEERATVNIQKMKKELSITQEQADKAYPILVENAKKLDAIRATGKDEAKKDEIAKQKEATDLKLKEILTPEQFTKYEAHKDAKEANKQKRADAKKAATKK
jgi:Spy/CpxP family protein refolding chaperone